MAYLPNCLLDGAFGSDRVAGRPPAAIFRQSRRALRRGAGREQRTEREGEERVEGGGGAVGAGAPELLADDLTRTVKRNLSAPATT
jgi:hypothetical protein